jgi:hypothetical protein
VYSGGKTSFTMDWTKKTQVHAMMMLRIAGVSIPPQLMRGPKEPGYREREPIAVSVSAAKRLVKAWDSRLAQNRSSRG